MKPGQIDILNCGTGHSEVHVDLTDPVNAARSKRIIEDMLRRGYALFITGADGALIRVEKFDPEKLCYIIGDGPLYAGETPEAEVNRTDVVAGPLSEQPKRGPGRPKGTKEVPIQEAHTTAIARTAGG